MSGARLFGVQMSSDIMLLQVHNHSTCHHLYDEPAAHLDGSAAML
jgi:hypothetical protein